MNKLVGGKNSIRVNLNNWRVVIYLMAGLLSACATSLPPSNEFLLMDSSPYQVESNSVQDVSVQLMPVVVANYLAGNEIVLVTKDGEVHRSQSNLWAEPLAAQLTRLTQQRLEKEIPHFNWFGGQRLPAGPMAQLTIEVDAFYADLEGMVHITGRWQLLSDMGELLKVRSFQITDKLAADGYSALTQTLSKNWFEKVVDPMADQLVSSFQ